MQKTFTMGEKKGFKKGIFSLKSDDDEIKDQQTSKKFD